MRVALLGGSFNPIHTDHLNIIKYCRQQLAFDEVWIVPNYQNPDKLTADWVAIDHRLRMIKMVVKGLPYVKVCELETAPGVHLTYQTITQLRAKYPQVKFTFCLGQDLLLNLESWDQFQVIKSNVQIICFQRDRQLRASENQILQRHGIRIYQFNNNNLCSTTIRRGGNLTKQLPVVNDYVNQHCLYLPARLQTAGLNRSRIQHCLQVAQTAQKLALKYQANPHHAYLAGALHDITKNWTPSQHATLIRRHGYRSCLEYHPNTYHAWSGSLYLQHHLLVNITNVLMAVRYHTVGHPHPASPLVKIIFVADKISPDRCYPGVDQYRTISQHNLTWCYYQLMCRTVNNNRRHLTWHDPLWVNLCRWTEAIKCPPLTKSAEHLPLPPQQPALR